jgi:serine/threonine protein phosphatase 1
MTNRLFAIGDIHGASVALKALVEAIAPQAEDTVVVLGDVIDCGPDSRGVLDQLIALSTRCHLVALRSNHEEMLLNTLESRSEFRYWFKLGGEQTLRSYSSAILPGLEAIPQKHLRFIRGCRPYHETETHIFVHATYDPDQPMDRQSDRSLRWESVRPERMRPHFSGKVVIAGHTSQKGGAILDLGFFKILDTDAYAGGSLTALEVHTDEIVQANQQGEARSIKLVYHEADVELNDRRTGHSGHLNQPGLRLRFRPSNTVVDTIGPTESSQEIVTEQAIT